MSRRILEKTTVRIQADVTPTARKLIGMGAAQFRVSMGGFMSLLVEGDKNAAIAVETNRRSLARQTP